MASSLFTLLLLYFSLTLRGLHAQTSADCNSTAQCGSNSACSFGGCACDRGFFSVSGSNTDCRNLSVPDPMCDDFDEDCVFCGREYEGPCQRCPEFIGADSKCLETCNVDFVFNIHPESRIPRRICNEATLPTWVLPVIIASVVVIILIVIGIIILACCLQRSARGGFDVETNTPTGTIRTKRSNSFLFNFKHNENANTSFVQENKDADNEDEDEIDGDDETVFKYKLNKLRKDAEVFLNMLNDMRRRFKELEPGSPAAEKYKNVMQDVTRLLYLLNKKPSKVKMPVDGVQLMRWSENILKRYLASQDKQKSLETTEIPSYMQGSAQDSKVFMEKLDNLRDHSQVFLRMLNDMRRRLKELRPEMPTAQNYRTISRDITRLLELLNKRPSTVEMPPDGLELVTQSEILLQRYLQSQEVNTEDFQTSRLSAFGAHDVTEF